MKTKMDSETAFGINLKRYRNEKNLNQGDLAKILDVAQNTLSEIERGKRFPDKKLRVKLCKFFSLQETDFSSHPDLLLAFNTFNKTKLK